MPRDNSFNRFRRKPPDSRDKDRDKGAGLPPLPLGQGGAPRTLWSSIVDGLQKSWNVFWLNPHLEWSGAALGSILALMGSLYGAYYLWNYHAAATGATEPISFPFRWTYPETESERPPLESLMRGFKTIFGESGIQRDAPAPDGDGEEYSASGGRPLEGAPAAAPAGSQEGAGAEDAGAAAEKIAADLKPAKGLGAGLPSAAGSAATGAGVGAGELGTPMETAAAAGAAGKGALASRSKRAAAPGRSLRGAGGKPGSLNALKQLKMTEKLSREASYSPKTGQSYETAQAAFGGGTSGSPIDGAGAGNSGGGIDTAKGGGGTGQSSAGKICPSGYLLTGGSCIPVEGENKTPYQGLVDMARMFVIGAALCALLGLFLLTRSGNPTLQILGGILLGIAAALVLAAVAIGNRVQDQYEQKAQNQAIQGSGNNALQGQSP